MTNWILTAIYKMVWLQFVSGPLFLISGFNDVLYYLTGGVIWDLLFGGKKNFSFTTIPYAFWGFCILAAAIVCLIFIFQYLALLFGSHKEIKSKLVTAVKMTGFGCIFVFFIPIGYFMLNQTINFIASELNSIFGTKTLNIAGMMWNIGNPEWDGSGIYTGNLFDTPSNILQYNMIAEIFGVWFMGFAFLMLGLALVQKIFELFFLFVTAPVVATTMVNDNGKRMIIWKDYVIAKSIASLGTIIAYYTFMIGIGAIIGSKLDGFNVAARQVLILLLICGGALACLGISNIIATFVGEGVGIREGLASISSTFAAAKMTMGAAKITGKALGFAKSKKALMENQTNFGSKGTNYAQQQANSFYENNAGTNQVEDNQPFKLPTNGLRQRSGALYMAGTAIALASTSVYAFGKAGKRAASGGKFITKVPRYIVGGTAGAVAQPMKATGRAIKKATVNSAIALKENTHGVYTAKRDHNTIKTDDINNTNT